MLNLLVGTGAPVAVAAVRRGASLPFRRSPANTVLFAETASARTFCPFSAATTGKEGWMEHDHTDRTCHIPLL